MSKLSDNYFLILFSFIPLSIILGSSVSLLNIILIDVSFIIFLLSKKNFNFFKNKDLKYLLALYVYLIFNSFISLSFSESFLRNFGFLRIIILFISINYFFQDNSFLKKVLSIWSLIILIVVFDVYFESINGRNILGYGGQFGGKGGSRIVSFFKDEPIVGGYLLAFVFLIYGFFCKLKFFEKRYLHLILIVLLVLSIILTGERSNSIKAIIGLIFLFLVTNQFSVKKRFLYLIGIISIFLVIIINSNFLKLRFVDQMKNFSNADNIYFELYRSGFEVFRNNPILGVGNKNYRVETCQIHENDNKNKIYKCSTHPHQIYLEFLSEHGIFGTILIFFLMYKIFFSKIYFSIKNNEPIQISAMIFLFLNFIPILPGGAFFSDYMITLFALNLSLFYAVNRKINIFRNIE